MRWRSVESSGGSRGSGSRVMLPCGGGCRGWMRRRRWAMVRMKRRRRRMRMRMKRGVERRVRVMRRRRRRQQRERLLMIGHLLFRHFALAAIEPRHWRCLRCLLVQDQGRSSCLTPRARRCEPPSIHDRIVRRSSTDFLALWRLLLMIASRPFNSLSRRLTWF